MLAGLSQLHTAFPAQPQCADKHQQCPNWAFAGQCDANQGFMKMQCAQSCDSCGWGPGMLSPLALRVAPAEEAQLMRSRAVGTCAAAPADALRWGADPGMATSICCHNRKGAEPSGSWEATAFVSSESKLREIRFTDVSTGKLLSVAQTLPLPLPLPLYPYPYPFPGKLLFVAPRNRTLASFLQESREHGWPSFRD
jgi:hypothetical protein